MWSAAILAVLSILGCFTSTPYPSDWAPIDSARVGSCPRIEGRYADYGVYAARCQEFGGKYQGVNDWNCSNELAANLLGLTISRYSEEARWIEIKQPDEDTLVVTLDRDSAPLTLKRSAGDFACDSGGVTVSSSGLHRRLGEPEGAHVYETTGDLLFGTVSVDRLSRRFQRAQDGSLIMTVTQSSTGALLFIPAASSHSQIVRWPGLSAEGEGKPSQTNR